MTHTSGRKVGTGERCGIRARKPWGWVAVVMAAGLLQAGVAAPLSAQGQSGTGAAPEQSAPAQPGGQPDQAPAPPPKAVVQQEEQNPLLSKKQDQLLDGQSGFLGGLYPQLGPDPKYPAWLIYRREPGVLARANSFYLEPVKVLLAPQVQKQDVPQEQLDKLADTFRQDMREALTKGHYKVMDQPGAGVMTLRFALTNIEPNGGKTNAVVSGSEAVATHAVAPGVGMVIPRIKVGTATVEGEMVDGQSGQVQMAFMTTKSGRRVFSGLKAFEKWGDIDAAFKTWAKDFRDQLDRAHKEVM
jgi:hypothetical protein